MNNRLNKPVTWHDILDIILMFVMAFLTVVAIAKGYRRIVGSNLNILHEYKMSVWLNSPAIFC